MHLGPDGPLVVGAQTCLFLDIRPHDPALETFSGGNFASAHPVSVEVAHTGEAGVAPFVIGVTAVLLTRRAMRGRQGDPAIRA